ncbi:MAG: pyroglutamyl-peptidase I [Candidatus Binataceae bacterium]
MASSRIFLLTGFAPFRGERINPSWEIARSLDCDEIRGLKVKSVKIPVGCAAAVRRLNAAIVRYRPRAILGLGQAGGRPAISIEKVAINLADENAAASDNFGASAKPVIAGAPEAYFARVPIPALMREMRRREIPAQVSLSAGAYACNALMYASLHLTRRRQSVPVGFIHLPYDSRQSAKHPQAPSMAIDVMETAIRACAAILARAA